MVMESAVSQNQPIVPPESPSVAQNDPIVAPEGGEVAQRREAIQAYEDVLLALPQAELKLEHFFTAGVYMRVLHIPADTYLTGRIHKYECINIIPQGDIEVATETGKRRVRSPAYFTSPPGTKRAAYVFSDTIWITVHADLWSEHDGETMADRLTVPSFEEYERFLALEQHRNNTLPKA